MKDGFRNRPGPTDSIMKGWAAEISKKEERWLKRLAKGIPRHISCKEGTSFSCLHGNRPAFYQIKTVYFQLRDADSTKFSFPSKKSLAKIMKQPFKN